VFSRNDSFLQELIKTRPQLDEKLLKAYWIAKVKRETHSLAREFIYDLIDRGTTQYLARWGHLLPSAPHSFDKTANEEE